MEIIRVTKNDLEVIAFILTHLIDESNRKDELPATGYLENLLTDDRTYLLAAKSNGIIAGYTLAYKFPSLYASEFLAYLYDIEVSPYYRRKGIGRLLIETLIETLKAAGVKEVWLGTAVDNAEGQGLFSSTGAVKSSETFNDYTYYLT